MKFLKNGVAEDAKDLTEIAASVMNFKILEKISRNVENVGFLNGI